MELLLLSSSRTRAGYLTDYLPAIRKFAGTVRRAVFIPFAAVALPWEEFGAKVGEALAPLDVAAIWFVPWETCWKRSSSSSAAATLSSCCANVAPEACLLQSARRCA